MNLFLDIETIPSQDPAIRERILAEIEQEKASVTAPGNYSKPDAIASYIEKKRAELDASLDERYRKTALDGGRGHIVCIGAAVDDAEVQVASWDPTTAADAAIAEARMLESFFAAIQRRSEKQTFSGYRWIGHHVRGFDLRFLYQRCVALGIRPKVHIPHLADPVSTDVFDTMIAWAGIGGRISLANLCDILAITGKGSELDGEEIDGSKVWDFVSRGEVGKVARYCAGDVERVREIYRRMEWSYSMQTQPTLPVGASA